MSNTLEEELEKNKLDNDNSLKELFENEYNETELKNLLQQGIENLKKDDEDNNSEGDSNNFNSNRYSNIKDNNNADIQKIVDTALNNINRNIDKKDKQNEKEFEIQSTEEFNIEEKKENEINNLEEENIEIIEINEEQEEKQPSAENKIKDILKQHREGSYIEKYARKRDKLEENIENEKEVDDDKEEEKKKSENEREDKEKRKFNERKINIEQENFEIANNIIKKYEEKSNQQEQNILNQNENTNQSNSNNHSVQLDDIKNEIKNTNESRQNSDVKRNVINTTHINIKNILNQSKNKQNFALTQGKDGLWNWGLKGKLEIIDKGNDVNEVKNFERKGTCKSKEEALINIKGAEGEFKDFCKVEESTYKMNNKINNKSNNNVEFIRSASSGYKDMSKSVNNINHSKGNDIGRTMPSPSSSSKK